MGNTDFSQKQIVCPPGIRISDYLHNNHVNIALPCGGQGTCGNCRIKVVAGNLPATNEDKAFLSIDEINDNIRLACRAVPETPVRISIPSPVNEDIKVEKGTVSGDVTPEKPDFTHEFGVAIDIGTTTIAAALTDITTGQVIDTVTCVNSQRSLGQDVISRIRAATSGNAHLLKKLIEKDIVSIGEKFFVRQPEAYVKVRRIVIACNTVMNHILLGYPCDGLGKAPFKAHSLAAARLTPAEFFTENGPSRFFSDKCVFETLPGIGPFVGSDIAAGLYVHGFGNSTDDMAFIDLGTNSEIALLHNKTIYITAASAGPAFEGGHISCGIPGIPGAIYNAEIKDNKCYVKTIDNRIPEGICGSGLVSAVSTFLQNDIIDSTGKFNENYFLSGFTFYKGVNISQEDIREFQLAKGAIRAGLEVLLQKADIKTVEKLYLAGGFGQNLNIRDASKTGIIPYLWEKKCESVGNSSLDGVVKYLSDKDARKNFYRIIDISREINLAEDSDFQSLYIKNMNF